MTLATPLIQAEPSVRRCALVPVGSGGRGGGTYGRLLTTECAEDGPSRVVCAPSSRASVLFNFRSGWSVRAGEGLIIIRRVVERQQTMRVIRFQIISRRRRRRRRRPAQQTTEPDERRRSVVAPKTPGFIRRSQNYNYYDCREWAPWNDPLPSLHSSDIKENVTMIPYPAMGFSVWRTNLFAYMWFVIACLFWNFEEFFLDELFCFVSTKSGRTAEFVVL